MPRITTPPGAYEIKMQDGTVYNSRSGHTEVSDDHARFIKRADAGISINHPTFARGGGDRECPQCGFHGFGFQKVCPRDGADMEVVPS